MNQADQSVRQFFDPIVRHAFMPFIELHDSKIQQYVTGVLADFHASDRLWSIRNADGTPVIRMKDLLMKADPVRGSAASFGEERDVHQHIGDYALFLVGVFPGSVKGRRPRWIDPSEGPEIIIDAGKTSYSAVAAFDELAHPEDASLFLKLSRYFELCTEGLHRVTREIAGTPHFIH